MCIAGLSTVRERPAFWLRYFGRLIKGARPTHRMDLAKAGRRGRLLPVSVTH